MHAKTDSEVTSISASSPARSPPRRPLYFVQSPSRDSHDGEKTVTTSFHSTPVLSPNASPPHSSSSTRFSAPHRKKDHHNHHHSLKQWKQIDVIEEEGLLQGEDRDRTLSRRCYFLIFLLGFLLLFTLFSLILWGASRPMKPKIFIKVFKLTSFVFDSCVELFRMKSEMGRDQIFIFGIKSELGFDLVCFSRMKFELRFGSSFIFRMKSELGLTFLGWIEIWIRHSLILLC